MKLQLEPVSFWTDGDEVAELRRSRPMAFTLTVLMRLSASFDHRKNCSAKLLFELGGYLTAFGATWQMSALICRRHRVDVNDDNGDLCFQQWQELAPITQTFYCF